MSASNAARLQGIGEQIRAAMSPVLTADADRDNARDLLNDAANGAQNTRFAVMASLAKLSAAGAWSKADIDVGARLAAQAKGNAETPKAVATFIGECKRAMHPEVREDFEGISNVVQQAWEAESAGGKDDPKPIRKAFKRHYHALLAVLSEAIDGRWYPTTDDLVAFAVSRDPDHDADKVLARLEKIRTMLSDFHNDFPVDDIGACVDFLGAITKDELVAARNQKLGVEPAPTTTATVVEDKPTAAENTSEDVSPDELLDGLVTPAAGAFDLDDLAGLSAAA